MREDFINGEDFNQKGGGFVTIGGLIVPAGLVILQNVLNKNIDLENIYKKTDNTINDDTYDKLFNLASAKNVNNINNTTKRFTISNQKNKFKTRKFKTRKNKFNKNKFSKKSKKNFKKNNLKKKKSKKNKS